MNKKKTMREQVDVWLSQRPEGLVFEGDMNITPDIEKITVLGLPTQKILNNGFILTLKFRVACWDD